MKPLETPLSDIQKITVALPAEQIKAMEDTVESGEYPTTGEIIREALRDWEKTRVIESIERDELRRLIQEGIDSGPALEVDLAEMKRKSIAEHEASKVARAS